MQLDKKKAQLLLKKLKFRKKRKNVAIALKRPDTLKKQQQLIQAVATFIEARKHEADFWFYSLDNNPVYPSDKAFGEEIVHSIRRGTTPVVYRFVPSDVHPSILFATFHFMDFIVAMRFHAAIFSYRTKKSFLGISYDAKCTSFIDAVGKVAHNPERITLSTIQSAYLKI